MISTFLLVKWQLAVYMSICFYLAMLVVAIGIRPVSLACERTRHLFFAMIVYIAVQFLIWIPLYDGIGFVHLVDSRNNPTPVWRFLWSPMAATLVIWLYIAHTIRSCKNYSYNLGKSHIVLSVKRKHMTEFVIGGIISTLLCASLFNLEKLPIISFIDTMMGIVIGVTFLELVISHWKHGLLTLPSPTLGWFFGTWLGAWVLSVI